VSDMMDNKIIAIKDGKVTVFAEGEQLEHPNGLFVDGDRLIVGGWGSGTGRTLRSIFCASAASGSKLKIPVKPTSKGECVFNISDFIATGFLSVAIWRCF